MWRERRAVTAIEYALIALIIVIGIIWGASSIGHSLTVTFNSVSSEL
ncbi:Flp family type IVb pilin [Acidocella aquatica]|nr:Flp family type IVb pilin [Acidocella aquatica]